MTLSINDQQEMFYTLLLARRLDERAWLLHRQGKIAFHVSGIGHEAAQVGAAFALRRGEDWFAPYYRDLAMMLALGLTPTEFVMGLMGKAGDPSSGGRQMPSHYGLRRANVVSHSAPVATQCVHATGIGLAIKLRGDERVALTCVGEGATSQGEWYEAVNWAAIHRLPVIFLVENNQYAISVRADRQMAVRGVAEKAHGLGLPGEAVDGNDLFAVHAAVSAAAERARAGEGPSVVECMVGRITPHSSDDDDRSYRTREEVEANKRNDPLLITRATMEAAGWLTPRLVDELEARAKSAVEEAVREAEAAPLPAAESAAYPVFVEDARHE